MTLKVSDNAISSLELAAGHSHCVVQDGLMIVPHGQRHAHASLSARQAKGLGLLTSGTYGPPHIGLSASSALSWYLANSLQVKMLKTGSTLYKLTWKVWAMPSGRRRFRLRASVRRTSGSVLTGWPTPTASNTKNAYQDAEKVIARKMAGRQSNLQDFACLAGWPTPAARDGKGGYQGGQDAAREAVNGYAGCDSTDSRPGPVNGFWGAADWLSCRDGKWRPVRSGSFPLANGVSARVGKLRTYGNAINVEAATAFITAYMATVDNV